MNFNFLLLAKSMNTRRFTLPLTILIAAIASAAPATGETIEDSSLITVPVFSEQTYHCVFPRRYNPAGKDGARFSLDGNESLIGFGSGFFLQSDSGPLFITARHTIHQDNLGGIAIDGAMYKADDEDESITRVGARTRVSGLAIKPTKIMIAEDLDLAIMQLPEATIKTIKPRILKTLSSRPTVGMEAQMYGYPPIEDVNAEGATTTTLTPYGRQDLVQYAVSHVSPVELTLNGGLSDSTEGGFSGGPVLDEKGQVMGMVIRADRNQTRCIQISEIMKHMKKFDKEAVEYADLQPDS